MREKGPASKDSQSGFVLCRHFFLSLNAGKHGSGRAVAGARRGVIKSNKVHYIHVHVPMLPSGFLELVVEFLFPCSLVRRHFPS